MMNTWVQRARTESICAHGMFVHCMFAFGNPNMLYVCSCVCASC